MRGRSMDFTLRPFCMNDAASIQLYANNPRIAKNMRDGFAYPFTENHAAALIKSLTKAPIDRVLARAICMDDLAVGSIGVFLGENVYRKTADIAYWLGEPFWGQGVMSRAIASLCSLAFNTFDIVRIQAEPFAQNLASHRALEKAGFTLEGIFRNRVFKDGCIQDAHLYALLRD